MRDLSGGGKVWLRTTKISYLARGRRELGFKFYSHLSIVLIELIDTFNRFKATNI